MTLAARHKITYLLFFLSILTNGLLLFFFINYNREFSDIFPLSETYQKWWFSLSSERMGTFFFNVTAHSALSIITLIASLVLILVFKRSSSQEIFYFQLFLLCLSFLSLRFFSYPLVLFRQPFSYLALLSRGVLFFRFNALLFLLLSGLSVFDSRFQKSDPFFLSSVLVSLCLAATIPLSDSFIQNTLTYLPINELNLFFLFMIIKLIIPVNFLWFLYQRKTLDYLILTLTMIFFIIAESLIFYMTLSGFITAMILLIIGTIFFSHRIHCLYLWR